MQLFSSLTGGEFLLFYTVLLGIAILAAWWIPANLRESGRAGESSDAESIAYLAGGPARFADSLLADLFVRGGLATGEKGRLVVVQASLPTSPAGKAVLAHDAPMTLGEAQRLLAVHAERVAARLRRSGLLMRREAVLRLRWLSISPYLVLLMIGLYRQRAGSALGEPTGFLIVLIALTVGLAVVRFLKFDSRTRAGIAAVETERARASRIACAPQPEEAALAVALFGTGVLVGTPWEPVHATRRQDGGGDGGGGCGGDSSGDGGGGCGGGGCGGCGG